MDSARWDRIQMLFHAAIDMTPADRDAFLSRECAEDRGLREAVTATLEADSETESVLERGVGSLARDVLGDAAPAALTSQQFGPYRIVRPIGEGGMGVVYLAERHDLGSVAAIKVLRDAWLSPARRERFASEQRTLARLNHPAIARLFDAGTLADGTPWIAMEYVEGVPLVDYCRLHTLALLARLGLFRGVCDAVQHAHRSLIIHRDIKPSNVLVTADGSVKLLDFGIAKQLASMNERARQTVTNLRLMTPAYAAPEQIRGEPVGIHTDVYCLGVVLYELLSGQLPYDVTNHTSAEIETMIVEQEPDRPSAVAHRLAPEARARAGGLSKGAWADLDVLCLTAMHKAPSRRYATVDALMRDVDHFVKGEPLDARPDSVRYRTGKFVRRHWRPLATAAAVLVVVIALVAFYTVRLTVARNAAVTEAARAQRIQRFMLKLFSGGETAVSPAEDLKVTALVDRGVQEARGLDSEPIVQAELYQTLGTIYRQLGDFERADALLRSALDQRRSLFGPTHPEVARSLVALGQLRDAQANFDEAERLIRQGLEMSRAAAAGAADPLVARATAAMGQVLENRGAYGTAIPTLEEAVRLHSAAGSDQADLAASLTELANTQFYAGHYAESEALNRRLLPMQRQIYGERHPIVADTLINLGAIQFEASRFGDAERFDREALDIIRAWYGNDHPETASALTILGRAIIQQGRLDEASGMMQEALTIQERVYGKVHPRVASAVGELGQIAVRQGRYEDAERHFRRMASIYREVYNDKHYLIGVALSNLAGVYHERADYRRAEELFREALARYVDTLRPDHQLVGIAKVRLGRTLLRQQRYSDAEREIVGGYDILMKQTSPPARWVTVAKEDLVVLYEALHQPARAQQFRVAAAAR